MKKVMLFSMLLVVSMLWGEGIFAQEYTTGMSSGKIIIKEVNRVDIIGTSAPTVKVYTEEKKGSQSERAKGLREISARGVEDNTGMGLSIEKEGSELTILPVSRSQGRRYTIEVPEGVSVYFEHSSNRGGKIKVRDLASEIEISTNYNSVDLENVTGAAIINTVYGGIDAVFDEVGSEDVILHSVYSFVDVSVPADAKASFQMNSSHGKILTDLDLDFRSEDGEGKMRNISKNKAIGDLNGGGAKFSLKATYNTIYLRKI
ncbi:MAG: hypothetical protein AAF388_14640 [Bacteroidota bacterium]